MLADGILFDLDGTLWDSCRVVSESWRETLQRVYGVSDGPGPREVRGIMGMTGHEIAQALFARYGAEAEAVCMRCIREENAYIARHGGDVYPGVREMLETLSARLPLFLVSNCQQGYIPCFLTCTGFAPFFSDSACEGDTGLDKAGNIALLCQRHGLRRPVYVGDTRADECSARAAGCAFIHAAYGFGDAERPDAVIHAPSELTEQIQTDCEERFAIDREWTGEGETAHG